MLNRDLLGICLGFFCFDYYWYVLVTWLPDYLVTVRHLTIVQAGFYGSLVFFTFGVCEPIGGWVADALIRRGWDETRTRKGIVTVAFFMGIFPDRSHASVDIPGLAIWLLDRSCAGRTCHRQSAGNSAMLRAVRKSRDMDRGRKFCRQSRRNCGSARGRLFDQAQRFVCSRLRTGSDHSSGGTAGLLVHRGRTKTQSVLKTRRGLCVLRFTLQNCLPIDNRVPQHALIPTIQIAMNRIEIERHNMASTSRHIEDCRTSNQSSFAPGLATDYKWLLRFCRPIP